MALLFIDGFDHYATADITKKWTWRYTDIYSSIQALGRTGANAMKGQNHYFELGCAFVTLPVTGNTGIFGCALKMLTHSSRTNDSCILGFTQYGHKYHANLGVAPNGQLYVSVSDTAGGTNAYGWNMVMIPGAISTEAIALDQWYYVEMKAVIDDTAGSVIVRLNGTEVINVSDVRTTATNYSATTWSDFHLSSNSTGMANQNAEYLIDDLYVCDGSGPGPYNTFLGDVKVKTCFPNAAGTYDDWTRAGADSGDNYNQVNEAAPNDATDYTTSATPGDTDSFATDYAAEGYAVWAVQHVMCRQKASAGTASVTPFFRIGGSDYTGTAQNPSAQDWQYGREIFTTSPDTATTWTEAEIEGLELGYQR